ncbi:MAG: low molecular weight protein-tyrosine-phosphatase [Oscillospiraceae bacterium]
MVKVLFICHGNICRSPMAEYLLRDMVRRQGLAAQFQIASAATSREEIGNDVYPPARELRAHGIPVGHRAAVQVTPRDYDDYDWLLTMDENNARNLRRILPHDPDGKIRPLLSFAGLQRGIADPWYTDDFGTTYDDLVLGCTAFLDALRRRGDIERMTTPDGVVILFWILSHRPASAVKQRDRDSDGGGENTSAGHGSPQHPRQRARQVMAAAERQRAVQQRKDEPVQQLRLARRAPRPTTIFHVDGQLPGIGACSGTPDSCVGSTVSFSPERASCCAIVLTFFQCVRGSGRCS